ncbi:MAG: ABC transporter substrate-binding protein [Armatimonadota bacterium]
MLARARGLPRGVPWAVATPALYYRSDLLREAGADPPRSCQELVDVAAQLADPPRRWGLGMPGPGQGGEELLHALALAMPPGDEAAGAQADLMQRLERALELVVEMQARGALQPETLSWGELELVQAFAQGRLGMVIAGPWAAWLLRAADQARVDLPPTEETAQSFEWAVAPLPVAEGGAGQVSVDWLVAFADTDRAEAAEKLLRYMAELESQRALAMLCGAPALTGLWAELAGSPPWSGHIPALRPGSGLPLGEWSDLRLRIASALYWALSGRLAPGAALERATIGEP